MLIGVKQIETKHRLAQVHLSGFRRVASMRTGTALSSASAVCLAVAISAPAMCSSLTRESARIAMRCAQSCRFLNSQVSKMTKLELV